ncbi:glycosyltransferase [Lysobacter xanthus]
MAHASSPTGGDALPVVVVPVGVDDLALDACLAALDVSTPAGTRIWLADDANGGPRVQAVIDAWRRGTPLQADYSRRARPLGEAAHLADVLAACGDADVAVLAADARPAPGWLVRMARCLREAPIASTITPWSNAGETAAWPRQGEVAEVPRDLDAIADAFAQAALPPAPLPAAVDHAVLIRGTARRGVGGVDGDSYRSWYAALIDLSLRMRAFGGADLLCTQAYVARCAEGRPADGDLERVAARWPAWTAALAQALMQDPLHAQRGRLHEAVAHARTGAASQADLFEATRT